MANSMKQEKKYHRNISGIYQIFMKIGVCGKKIMEKLKKW